MDVCVASKLHTEIRSMILCGRLLTDFLLIVVLNHFCGLLQNIKLPPLLPFKYLFSVHSFLNVIFFFFYKYGIHMLMLPAFNSQNRKTKLFA